MKCLTNAERTVKIFGLDNFRILIVLTIIYEILFCQYAISQTLIGGLHSSRHFVFKMKPNRVSEQNELIINTRDGKTVLRADLMDGIVSGVVQAIEFKPSHGNILIKKKKIKKHCKSTAIRNTNFNEHGVIFEGDFTDDGCAIGFEISFAEQGPKQLDFEIKLTGLPQDSPDDKKPNIVFKFSKNLDQRFYGFGAQASHLNLNHKNVRILSTEQGHGRGLQPYTKVSKWLAPGVAGDELSTYAPVPFYFTEKNRGLYLKNSEYSEFDLSNTRDIKIMVASTSIAGVLIVGDNPLDIVNLFTEYTGRMKVLPDWSHQGAVLGLMGGSDVVRRKWAHYKKYDLEIAAFWLQDWVGKRKTSMATRLWWNWVVDRKTYPDWEKLVFELEDSNIPTLAYINPFVTPTEGRYFPPRRLFDEALDQDFLVKDLEGEPVAIDSGGFEGYLIDFTADGARQWLKDIIKDEFLKKNVKGWMADFGEALPLDTVMASGEKSNAYHNQYPVEWAKIQNEAIEEFKKAYPFKAKDTQPVVFHRSGFTKSPAEVGLFWLGDQLVSWDEHDGLKSSITALISAGLSGQTINHSDVGGYISMTFPFMPNLIRTRELMKRWTELNTFTSFLRTHEGTNPELGIQFDTDDDILKFFAYYSRVFKELFLYRKAVFKEASAFGYPVVRPLFLHYPDDQTALKFPYQFLMGKDLLVAPVTEPGVDQKKVYLPKGRWTNLWDGKNLLVGDKGAIIDVSAPLGYIPVFFNPSNEILKDIASAIRILERPMLSKN